MRLVQPEKFHHGPHAAACCAHQPERPTRPSGAPLMARARTFPSASHAAIESKYTHPEWPYAGVERSAPSVAATCPSGRLVDRSAASALARKSFHRVGDTHTRPSGDTCCRTVGADAAATASAGGCGAAAAATAAAGGGAAASAAARTATPAAGGAAATDAATTAAAIASAAASSGSRRVHDTAAIAMRAE